MASKCKCDCGAEKARTSHSTWCSSLKPAPATAKSTVFNDDWIIDMTQGWDPPEYNDE